MLITQHATWLYFDIRCQTVTMLLKNYHSHKCVKTLDTWRELCSPEMTDCAEEKNTEEEKIRGYKASSPLILSPFFSPDKVTLFSSFFQVCITRRYTIVSQSHVSTAKDQAAVDS